MKLFNILRILNHLYIKTKERFYENDGSIKTIISNKHYVRYGPIEYPNNLHNKYFHYIKVPSYVKEIPVIEIGEAINFFSQQSTTLSNLICVVKRVSGAEGILVHYDLPQSISMDAVYVGSTHIGCTYRFLIYPYLKNIIQVKGGYELFLKKIGSCMMGLVTMARLYHYHLSENGMKMVYPKVTIYLENEKGIGALGEDYLIKEGLLIRRGSGYIINTEEMIHRLKQPNILKHNIMKEIILQLTMILIKYTPDSPGHIKNHRERYQDYLRVKHEIDRAELFS
jgi:hypothetical protein